MYEIINNLNGFKALKKDWDILGKQFPSPMLQHDWFLACIEELHNPNDIRVFVVRNENRITAIAPLVIRKSMFCTWLEFIGISRLYEPCDFLYESIRDLTNLIEGILSANMPMSLQRIPEESFIWSVLGNKTTNHRVHILKKETAGSLYINTTTSWVEFLDTMSSHRRWLFRNGRRRIEKEGMIEVKFIRSANEKLSSYLEDFIRIEAAGWKSRSKSSLQDNLSLQKFFRNYFTMADKAGKLRIAFYKLNNTAIAALLGVEYADRIWIFKSGYDEKWKRFSPGMQITHEAINDTFKNGLAGYEFLGSEERWEHAWPVSRHVYFSCIIYPLTIRGLFGLIDTVVSKISSKLKRL